MDSKDGQIKSLNDKLNMMMQKKGINLSESLTKKKETPKI